MYDTIFFERGGFGKLLLISRFLSLCHARQILEGTLHVLQGKETL